MSKYKVNSIDDILMVAKQENIPLEDIRFFIGKDEKYPKAFGIFQDETGMWVVYKNKSDGSRSIRYRGESEQEACQIIWDKLEEETKKQKKNRDWWIHQELLVEDAEAAEEKGLQEEVVRNKSLVSTEIVSKLLDGLYDFGRWVVLVAFVLTLLYQVGNIVETVQQNNTQQIEIQTRKANGYYHHFYEWFYFDNPYWYHFENDAWKNVGTAEPSTLKSYVFSPKKPKNAPEFVKPNNELTSNYRPGYYKYNNDWFYYNAPYWYYFEDNSWNNGGTEPIISDGYTYSSQGEGVDTPFSYPEFSTSQDETQYDSSDSYYYNDSQSYDYDLNDYYWDSDWSSSWDDSWDSSSGFDYDFSDWDSSGVDWDSDW